MAESAKFTAWEKEGSGATWSQAKNTFKVKI